MSTGERPDDEKVKQVTVLYKKGKLVYADLSEYIIFEPER